MRFRALHRLLHRARLLNWVLVTLLTVFALAPLTYPGFFEAHSGFLPALNVEHLSDAPNWGRTPDPLRGEGKLPYLLAWPFLKLSGSGMVAIKWGYGLTFVLGALAVYAWTRHGLGAKGGMLAAVIYTYLPWHLSTVYVRGAYAEAWLWALWPLTLWAVDRLAERRPLSILIGIAIGLPLLAATFWTQPGLAALFTPLLVAYNVVLTPRRKGRILWLAGALALLFAMFLILGVRAPEAVASFSKGFVWPFQLLSAAWGSGLSFQLGLSAVGLSIVALALWANKRTRGANEANHPSESADLLKSLEPARTLGPALWFWPGVLALLILLMLPVLPFLWHGSGLDRFLTQPGQLLALTGLPLAFLAGSAVRLDERLAGQPALAGLVALVVLASYPYLAPRFTQVDPGPEPVALIQPVGADSAQIMILDYEIALSTEITTTLALTLTWQAQGPVGQDYTAFVHVMRGDEKIAQRDAQPCGGECPTSSWQPGEIVVDRTQLDLPPGAPPGPYRLAVGLYLLGTGERAAVVGRDDGTVYLDVP
jgi:hypothetical protein